MRNGRVDQPIGRRQLLRRGLGAVGGLALSRWTDWGRATGRAHAADAAVSVTFWHANPGPLGRNERPASFPGVVVQRDLRALSEDSDP